MFESLRDRGCVVEAVLPTVDLVDVTCPAGWSRRVRAEASIIVGPDLGSLPTAGNEWFENWTLLVKGDEGGRAFLVQMQFVAPPDKPATTPLLVFRGRLRCTLERQLGLPPESGAPACR